MSIRNPPLYCTQNPPTALLVQSGRGRNRQYTRTNEIETLAIERFRKNGSGITTQDLISKGLATHKISAREKLKYFRQIGILFTTHNVKPQRYFPSCLKSEIFDRISKNTPVEVTEVPHFSPTRFGSKDDTIIQTLEGYVLPLLHDVPLNIHKLHLMTKIESEYYHEIALPSSRWNSAKEHQEIVGTAFVKYIFYANGAVMVFIESSNNPFKLEDYDDLGNLIAFLGQVRDRLVVFLQDRHERITPEIMRWELKQCDINRDVKVSDWLQLTGLKIQLRHTFHLFRVYIKSKGKDTVCRIEESVNFHNNKSVVEAINAIFNPTERLEKQILELDKKLVYTFALLVALQTNMQKSHGPSDSEFGLGI